MYGAVSRDGIKADLQAMKDVGLGGCYLMPIRGMAEAPATLPPLTEEPAQQLSPRFWQMADYAMEQADSLGLEMGIHICDGFALAGGPWISPEESMQEVVWSDTIVSYEALRYSGTSGTSGVFAPYALRSVSPTLLPAPAVEPGGYYEDIAVFACPVSSIDEISPSVVTGSIKRDEKGTFRSKEPGYIEYDFGQPVTVRSIEVWPSANNVQSQRLLVQASVDDGGTSFRDVRQLVPPLQGWQNTTPPTQGRKNTNHYTYSLPETTACHFRFCWTPEGTPPGAEDMDAAKWSPVLKLNDIRLSAQPVIDQYESKNGSVWRCLPPSPPSQGKGGGGAFVRIIRFGHTSTLHQNATAGGGRGLECDKFSASAVNKQIDHWFGLFMQRPHHDIVKYMHVDSWECGSQNWSKNFPGEFRRRRGYDLLPFLPVYAGVHIDDTAEARRLGLTSEQVLRDIRLTINDLLQDVFFATVRERAHHYGVQLSCESVAPTMVSDGMGHYRHSDVPMGEFWLNSPTHDKPNDMLDAISGAHVYGKRIVQAEGFTEVRGVWDETPANLKTLLDRNFALGMNRLFFHVFTHNPWTDKKPGMTLDGIGLFFQRDQTWFSEARAFVDYVTRCQQWLQRGWPVVDIAVYTGDDMPRRAWRPEQLADMLPGLIGPERVAAELRRRANEGVPMEESPVGVNHNANIADPADWVNALGGYSYDSLNPDALMGNAVPFSGNGVTRYRALVIPYGVHITPATRARIDSLRHSGMTIIDSPWQRPTLDALAPDVTLPRGVAFCHRRDGEQDIYFLANQTDSPQSFKAVFRQNLRGVVLYDPLGDRYITPDIVHTTDDGHCTTLRMEMQPRHSLFVIFGPASDLPQSERTGLITSDKNLAPKATYAIPAAMATVGNGVADSWQLTFRESGLSLNSDTLFSWADHANASVRYFSGHVRYSTTLAYHPDSRGGRVILSLGDVRDIAHVWLNGQDVCTLWLPPYEVDVTDHLHRGSNTMEVEVVNTWHNALRGMDSGTPPYNGVWTNARYRTKGDQLLPAGLLGPVKLRQKPAPFRVDTLSDEVFRRMVGKSYPKDCTVRRSDLRLLHVLHVDAEGHEHEGEMVCNKAIAQDLLHIFRRLYEARYPIERMRLIDDYDADDERSMTDNNTSCFCFRQIAGSKKLSKHSLGLAVDINPLYNPCVRQTAKGGTTIQPAAGRRYADRSKKSPYKIEKGDLCYRLFTEHGFTWGGSWRSVKDYQHFESDGQRHEVHILSVNDMHAALERMPRLAAIADSLRGLYPSLIVLSAGDNRTGNPLNDKYQPSGYPMVALMNQIGFQASAIGNHDFDMQSLPQLMPFSDFSYLCANVGAERGGDGTPESSMPASLRGFEVFDVDGLRVGIIGVVQTDKRGTPDTHPDNIVGLRFENPVETVRQYEWLSRQCDVTMLLSHSGYRTDTLTAQVCPWLDLIVGGHTHKQLKDDDIHDGVLITQNSNRLMHATHITLVVDSGRVTSKHAEYIDVKDFSGNEPVVAGMVKKFSDNPYFQQVLAQATTPFDDIYEIGCMVCDAMMQGTGADVSIQNYRGVRMLSMPAGDITIKDVLTIDPFGNAVCMLTVTGKELTDIVNKYSRMEIGHFPHLGGLQAELTINRDNPEAIDSIKLMMPDGSPIDMARTYRVATNSYVGAACRSYGITMEKLNHETSDIIMQFLQQQGTVAYQGVKRIFFKL